MPDPTEKKSWHREPWPWFLMAGPAIVVVAGSITSAIAFVGADGLVADDYYKQGVAINRTIARDSRARALAIRGEIAFEGDKVRANLQANAPLPDHVRLTLAHATRAGEDRKVVLVRDAAGSYWAPIAAVPAGRWSVILETSDWRVAAATQLGSGAPIAIAAGGS